VSALFKTVTMRTPVRQQGELGPPQAGLRGPVVVIGTALRDDTYCLEVPAVLVHGHRVEPFEAPRAQSGLLILPVRAGARARCHPHILSGEQRERSELFEQRSANNMNAKISRMVSRPLSP
jgi:hypothetical protein